MLAPEEVAAERGRWEEAFSTSDYLAAARSMQKDLRRRRRELLWKAEYLALPLQRMLNADEVQQLRESMEDFRQIALRRRWAAQRRVG